MRILFLNTSELTGGAAIAASRLMKALNKESVDAKMLVRDKISNSDLVYTVNVSWFKRKLNFIRFLWERLIIFVFTGFDRKNLFRASIANTGTDISKHELVRNADVIHLHWINQGFLSLNDIKKIGGLNKPIVWTMHDMWPCTGIYHHVKNSPFYTDLFGKRLLTKIVANKKREIYKNGKITFVGCSKWLASEAKNSTLTQSQAIYSIPNPIDTGQFKPLTSYTVRKAMHLPENKHLILFGALNATDKQKGIDFFIESLLLLKKKNPDIHKKTEIVVFGQTKTEIEGLFNVPIHSMGYLNETEQIVELYNSVDLFVTSSLEENLPNTIMESMACGIPCVGFKTGGIPEMIDHKTNGYLAEYKNAEDLANGIEWVLNHPDRELLSAACVEKVQTHYSESVVARQYIDLYKSLLKE